MALPIPGLDNRTFEELVQEAVRSIPVYSPEWTDHNLHDPGITFLELFAWLTEMQLYSLDQINDCHLLKYLSLLDARPIPASPSIVDLQFEVKDSTVKIEAGTRVKTGSTLNEVFFETDKTIEILPVEIGEIVSFSSYQHTDFTAFNEPGKSYYHAFGESPGEGDALHIGLKLKVDMTSKQLAQHRLTLGIFLYEEDLPPVGCHGSEPAEVIPPAAVTWQFWDGSQWEDLEIEAPANTILTLSASGQITFKFPVDIKKDEPPELNKTGKYYWIRCRVDQAGYEIPPRIDRILPNVVTAVGGQTIKADNPETVGKSSGLPYQEFKIRNTPVISGTQVVTVEHPGKNWEKWQEWSAQEEWEKWQAKEDFDASGPNDLHYIPLPETGEILLGNDIGGMIPPKGAKIEITCQYKTPGDIQNPGEPFIYTSTGLPGQAIKMPGAFLEGSQGLKVNTTVWKAVEDFDASGPYDRHYILNPGKGELFFGNNVNGAVPPQGAAITIAYRYGSGAAGNVSAGAITLLESHIQGITLSNPFPAREGKDAETIKEAFIRFKRHLETPYTAVTALDFQQIVKATPGIRAARAKAVFSRVNIDHVNLVVVPYSLMEKPLPSSGFKETVYRHLTSHRLITTSLEVSSPDYVKVSVTAEIKITPGYDPGQTRERVQLGLRQFLSPLKRNEGDNEWPFGRPVYRSEVSEKINTVEGVDCITSLSLSAESGEFTYNNGNIEIGELSLVYPGTHRINIASNQKRCQDSSNK